MYILRQNGHALLAGDEYTVREKIEDLLDAKVGFFVSLQENTDDDKFVFYLHSQNEDDLTQSQLDTLDSHYGINTHDDEGSEFAIKQLLDITITEV